LHLESIHSSFVSQAGLFTYSRIVQKSRFMSTSFQRTYPPYSYPQKFTGSWPNSKKVAIIPVLNIEIWYSGNTQNSGPPIQPHLARLNPDVANSGWRKYGNRVGLPRLVNIFNEIGIPFTCSLNADIIEQEPYVLKTLETSKTNWDIVAHGLNNSQTFEGLSLPLQEEYIEESLTILRKLGKPITGWSSPGFATSNETASLLSSHGIQFSLDCTDDDAPYLRSITTEKGNKEIIYFPYSMETNDITLILNRNYTGEEYENAIVDHVQRLCDENKDCQSKKIVALGIHTFIIGQPGRALHLRNALIKMQSMPQVWFANYEMLLKNLR